jgi:hypothetical protein
MPLYVADRIFQRSGLGVSLFWPDAVWLSHLPVSGKGKMSVACNNGSPLSHKQVAFDSG